MGSFRRGIVAFIAMCLPTLAIAQGLEQCIGEYALDDGVRIDFADGTVMDFQGVPDGLVEIARLDPREPGVVRRYTSLHGIYFLDEFQSIDRRVQSEGRVRTVFGAPLSALPLPGETQSWEGQNLNIITGRVQPRVEIMQVEFGTDTVFVEVGRCSYQAVRLAIRYEWPEDGFGQSLRFVYLTNIGIGIPIESRFDGQPPVLFEPIDIRRVR